MKKNKMEPYEVLSHTEAHKQNSKMLRRLSKFRAIGKLQPVAIFSYFVGGEKYAPEPFVVGTTRDCSIEGFDNQARVITKLLCDTLVDGILAEHKQLLAEKKEAQGIQAKPLAKPKGKPK